jgi:hypothetical protein
MTTDAGADDPSHPFVGATFKGLLVGAAVAVALQIAGYVHSVFDTQCP